MTTAALISVPTAPRHRWLRSVGAVVGGLAANAVLASATDMLLVATAVFPPLRDFGNATVFSDSMLALALAYRTLYGVLGCYITARLAPVRPMAHAVALGCVGTVIGVVGAAATWDAWTHWYSLAIIAVTLPSSWLGARLYLSKIILKTM